MRAKFRVIQKPRFKRRAAARETEGGQYHERHRRQEGQSNARCAQGQGQQASPQIQLPLYQYW